jgi:hypothetical protein
LLRKSILIYGETKISLISEILKRETIEVFAKWVDLQMTWQIKGEKAVRQRWTKAEDELIL